MSLKRDTSETKNTDRTVQEIFYEIQVYRETCNGSKYYLQYDPDT